MSKHQNIQSGERGGSLLEFTVVATGLFMMLIGIVAGANLYFTHNALVEATRRGARFAATQEVNSEPAIRSFAIYGNSEGTGSPLLSNLQPENIVVQYTNFGVGQGTVSVSITNYNYDFAIPGVSRLIAMPPYRSTAAGESAGESPPP